MSAWKTIKCKYFRLQGGRLIEQDGRAQPELVYSDPYAAANKLLAGSPVYVDLAAVAIFCTVVAEGQPEVRFK